MKPIIPGLLFSEKYSLFAGKNSLFLEEQGIWRKPLDFQYKMSLNASAKP